MFPIQFTYELSIHISWSLQAQLALVPYFSQTFHSVCFLFSIQLLILDLNLLKDNGRKGSGPIGLDLAPSLASLSAVSLVPSLWLPGLPPTELSAFLYSPLRAVILYHWLLGLQLLLDSEYNGVLVFGIGWWKIFGILSFRKTNSGKCLRLPVPKNRKLLVVYRKKMIQMAGKLSFLYVTYLSF